MFRLDAWTRGSKIMLTAHSTPASGCKTNSRLSDSGDSGPDYLGAWNKL